MGKMGLNSRRRLCRQPETSLLGRWIQGVPTDQSEHPQTLPSKSEKNEFCEK